MSLLLDTDTCSAHLKQKEMDLMIAATAIAQNLTVVTHNVQDYANVPGLTIDDWLVP